MILTGQVLNHHDPLGGVHHYVYDDCGNRFTSEEVDGGRRVIHANGVVYEQDISGQVINRQIGSEQQRYQWDSQGRLVQLTTAHQCSVY